MTNLGQGNYQAQFPWPVNPGRVDIKSSGGATLTIYIPTVNSQWPGCRWHDRAWRQAAQPALGPPGQPDRPPSARGRPRRGRSACDAGMLKRSCQVKIVGGLACSPRPRAARIATSPGRIGGYEAVGAPGDLRPSRQSGQRDRDIRRVDLGPVSAHVRVVTAPTGYDVRGRQHGQAGRVTWPDRAASVVGGDLGRPESQPLVTEKARRNRA
jgi:hypothetical protein